jgi:hypothetical protein
MNSQLKNALTTVALVIAGLYIYDSYIKKG